MIVIYLLLYLFTLTSVIIALKSQNSCSPRACARQILVSFYPWPREISWNWVREGEDRQVKDSLMDDPSLQSNTWMEPFYSSKSPANAKLVGRAVHLALFGRRWRSLSARWKKISSCVPCPKYILRWYSSSSIFLTGNIPLCTDEIGVRGFSWLAWGLLFSLMLLGSLLLRLSFFIHWNHNGTYSFYFALQPNAA